MIGGQQALISNSIGILTLTWSNSNNGHGITYCTLPSLPIAYAHVGASVSVRWMWFGPLPPPPQVTSGSVPPPLRAGRGCHSTFPSDAPLHTGPDWTLVSGQLCRPRQGQSSCYRQSAAASRTGRPAGHPAQGSPAHTEAAEAHRNGIGARQPFI